MSHWFKWLAWPLLHAFCCAAVGYSAPPSERAMAQRIDSLLAERWRAESVTPAPLCSDETFLRRASLDLTGTIPTVHDVRRFLADATVDKRERLVTELLQRPSHAMHLANVWRRALLPPDANAQLFGTDAGFHTWLRTQFADNTPYDKMVTELLVARGQAGQVGPALFYVSLQLKPEELAASTSRIFLGTQIQCAQCHNHPFDHWSKEDFWGYAAFFAQLQRPRQSQAFPALMDAPTGEVMLPDSNQVIKPKFLAGDASPDGELTRRMRLAIWMTSRDNPYFAKAAVNRLWGLLFGRGLVHPIDDMGGKNLPSHPRLLDELAGYFANTAFDVRRLLRTLAMTEAYQRDSAGASDGDRPELFAQMAIKPLSAEQLYDCVTEAMRKRVLTTALPGGGFVQAGGFNQGRAAFLAKFGASVQTAGAQYEAGIPQALTMMNGPLLLEATDLQNSDLLHALDAPFLTADEQVEILFLSALSRFPRPEECDHFLRYVANTPNKRQAHSDILWALLNSAEFALNH